MAHIKFTSAVSCLTDLVGVNILLLALSYLVSLLPGVTKCGTEAMAGLCGKAGQLDRPICSDSIGETLFFFFIELSYIFCILPCVFHLV